MPIFIWDKRPQEHIENDNCVSYWEFREAWYSRQDVETRPHDNGEYTISYGKTDAGRTMKLFWRWQHGDEASNVVFPITACFR